MVERDPFCRDYSGWITLRLFLVFVLWVFYGLIPHELPLDLLIIPAIAMLLYAFYLFWKKRRLMFWLMLIAAGLNFLLMAYIGPGINLTLTLIITVILLYDVIDTPQHL